MDGVQVAAYVLGVVFAVGFASKMYHYSHLPIHLRWELYPIPGEKGRPWGGSYLEEAEWWAKPREKKSLMGELKFMGQEILYFKEYFHSNRSLWYIVYPFHMGVFLFVVFFFLLIVGAITMVADIGVSGHSANAWGKFLYYLTLVSGVAAMCLGSVGTLALLIRKWADPGMKAYTRRVEYFNILFVLAVFVTGLLAWATADTTFAAGREFVRSLFSFKEIGMMESVIIAHIVLLGVFLAYLPFTNMMHFFAKHFTFNSVRWEDSPNLRGSMVEQRLQTVLQYRVSWSAAHVKGIRRWADISELPGEAPVSKRSKAHE